MLPVSASWTPLRAGDLVVRRAACLGVAWLVAIAVLIALIETRFPSSGPVVDVARLVPIALAVGLAVRTAVVTGGRIRLAWVLLSASATLLLVGEIIAFPDARIDRATSVSVTDVLLLGSYAFAVPALLIGAANAGHLRRIRGLLDAGLLALGLGTLRWDLAVVPAVPKGVRPVDVLPFVRPVLGLTVAATLVTVGLAGRRRLPVWCVLVGAAFGVAGVTEVGPRVRHRGGPRRLRLVPAGLAGAGGPAVPGRCRRGPGARGVGPRPAGRP